MKTWHYVTPSGSNATIDENDLQELIEQGAILPETQLWTTGMKNWQRAIELMPDRFSDQLCVPPPLPPANSQIIRSHVIDFEIIGDDLQMVEIELDPGETVIAEAGAMNYMEEGIQFETRAGDGSEDNSGVFGTLLGMGKRFLSGESLFMTHFTNTSGHGKKRVAFAAPYPGCIIPIDLNSFQGSLLCQRDAFLCAAKGTKLGIAFTQRLGAGFFGGEGFILQRLDGDGMAFIHAGGTIIKKELHGEKLYVDTGCLVAFTEGIQYSIERSGGLKTMFLGGEGIFLATLSGHGTVWLQSMPFARLADRILARSPKTNSN